MELCIQPLGGQDLVERLTEPDEDVIAEDQADGQCDDEPAEPQDDPPAQVFQVLADGHAEVVGIELLADFGLGRRHQTHRGTLYGRENEGANV
jgi:hypothetical protein